MQSKEVQNPLEIAGFFLVRQAWRVARERHSMSYGGSLMT
jgi:hypothetical protein